MIKIVRLAVLFSVSILIISCGRQIDCPDFDTKTMEWTPYQNNDTIRLINSSNDSILKLVINNVLIQHTTHYKTNLDCGTCDDDIIINGNETNDTNVRINISLNENNIIGQSFVIKGVYFALHNSNYSEKVDYSFEGIKYDVVRIFEKNDTNDRFNKLILAKGFGIIGLFDKNDDVWKIQNSIKSKGKSNEITNIACD